jgi:hypothetical protein
MLAGEVDQAQVSVEVGRRRTAPDRPAQQPRGLVVVAALVFDETQQVKGGGVLAMPDQDATVLRFGLIQAARGVVVEPCLHVAAQALLGGPTGKQSYLRPATPLKERARPSKGMGRVPRRARARYNAPRRTRRT